MCLAILFVFPKKKQIQTKIIFWKTNFLVGLAFGKTTVTKSKNALWNHENAFIKILINYGFIRHLYVYRTFERKYITDNVKHMVRINEINIENWK